MHSMSWNWNYVFICSCDESKNTLCIPILIKLVVSNSACLLRCGPYRWEGGSNLLFEAQKGAQLHLFGFNISLFGLKRRETVRHFQLCPGPGRKMEQAFQGTFRRCVWLSGMSDNFKSAMFTFVLRWLKSTAESWNLSELEIWTFKELF